MVARDIVDQAHGALVESLNEARREKTAACLEVQSKNLKDALAELKGCNATIKKRIVENGRGRGGATGVHGFIAEVAEVGIGNARKLVLGDRASFEWIDNNGIADLVVDDVEYQMKFVRSGGMFSLDAVSRHLEKYPDFVKDGGRYRIPKDFYDAICELHDMSEDEAKKLGRSGEGFSPRQYQRVKKLFDESGLALDDIEPSLLEYDEVQRNAIDSTLERAEDNVRETDRSRREAIRKKGESSLAQGMRGAALSAGIGGVLALSAAIASRLQEGRRLGELGQNDWVEIANEAGAEAFEEGFRDVSIYALTNYTAASGAVASSLVTAYLGVAEQAHMLRNGLVNEVDFYVNSQTLCLEAAVNALSSTIGQVAIPIPVLGAVIGSAVGNVLYQAASSGLSAKEQELVEKYADEQNALDAELASEYESLVIALNAEMSDYMSLVVAAFNPNPYMALEGSCELARALGVPEEETLDSLDEIDAYFLE